MIDFGDGTGPMPYISGEFLTHDYEAIGDFTILVLVTNDLGCTDTFSRQICVENKVLIYIPNIFSPNGDGNNDVLGIDAYGTGVIRWTIFSRWGEKIYEANTPDAVWDGTYYGHALDPGVFVVQINYTNQETGEKGEKISTVTLVR